MNELRLRVAGLAARIAGLKHVPVESTKLSDLCFDSLDKIELVTSCEDEFGIRIPETDEASIRTVGDAADLVERLLKREAA